MDAESIWYGCVIGACKFLHDLVLSTSPNSSHWAPASVDTFYYQNSVPPQGALPGGYCFQGLHAWPPEWSRVRPMADWHRGPAYPPIKVDTPLPLLLGLLFSEHLCVTPAFHPLHVHRKSHRQQRFLSHSLRVHLDPQGLCSILCSLRVKGSCPIRWTVSHCHGREKGMRQTVYWCV